ncbi:hypothetical protein ACFL7E_00080 [Thermodesulfobacteriota bacterium]
MTKKKYDSKRCPECLTHIPGDATKCTSCGQKVGEPDKTGMAKRPVDLGSYVMALIAFGALGFFIWYAFLK